MCSNTREATTLRRFAGSLMRPTASHSCSLSKVSADSAFMSASGLAIQISIRAVGVSSSAGAVIGFMNFAFDVLAPAFDEQGTRRRAPFDTAAGLRRPIAFGRGRACVAAWPFVCH